jgi:hypothetical protein
MLRLFLDKPSMISGISKVNRASTLIEATAALALVLSVTFFVSWQDSLSLAQTTRDARLAAAQLFLENETALARASLPPWVNIPGETPHLALYGTNGALSYTNVSLIGDAGNRIRTNLATGSTGVSVGDRELSTKAARFQNNVVKRELISRSAPGYDGMEFHVYQVEVELPNSLVVSGDTNTTPRTEVLRRTVQRVFAGP